LLSFLAAFGSAPSRSAVKISADGESDLIKRSTGVLTRVDLEDSRPLAIEISAIATSRLSNPRESRLLAVSTRSLQRSLARLLDRVLPLIFVAAAQSLQINFN
jgi:hypothetical protein